MFWLVLITLLSGVAGLFVFIYSQRNGLLDNLEDTKYQVFRNEKDEVSGPGGRDA